MAGRTGRQPRVFSIENRVLLVVSIIVTIILEIGQVKHFILYMVGAGNFGGTSGGSSGGSLFAARSSRRRAIFKNSNLMRFLVRTIRMALLPQRRTPIVLVLLSAALLFFWENDVAQVAGATTRFPTDHDLHVRRAQTGPPSKRDAEQAISERTKCRSWTFQSNEAVRMLQHFPNASRVPREAAKAARDVLRVALFFNTTCCHRNISSTTTTKLAPPLLNPPPPPR
jgi:hypothetical protein